MRFSAKLMMAAGFLALATVGNAQPPREKEQPKEGRPGVRPEGRPGERPEGRPGARPEGRPGEGRPGAPGGFGRGGMMQPGQVLPPFLVEILKLSEDQKKELAKIQKETEEKLDKLLTDDQKKQLKDMRERGPGGDRGRPGAEGRPGGDRPGERRPGGDRPEGERRPGVERPPEKK